MDDGTSTSRESYISQSVEGGQSHSYLEGARKFELLRSAVELVEAGRPAAAAERLNHLIGEVLDVERNPEDLSYLIFAAGLSKRLDHGSSVDANLYLRQYAVPQIRLFNLLATRVPHVYLAGAIANDLLCEQMRGEEGVSLVDVGIGTGRQMVALLRRMAEKGLRPEQLTLVGIEPAAAALAAAEQGVREAATELGLRVRFIPIRKLAEDFTQAEWDALAALPGKLLINESFAVHHVARRQERELRQDVLERLRALNPAAFVLSEPSADHLEPDLSQRFRNCWEHFSLGFRALDGLELSLEERNALKAGFFGREIEDILGGDEGERSERHETVDMWRERLARAGFSLAVDAAHLAGVRSDSGVIQVGVHGDHVGLDYQGHTLVGVMLALPSRG